MHKTGIVRMSRVVAAAALLAACLHVVAIPRAMAGDYQDGWQAYNRGDHAAAYEIWKPLADRGDNQAQLMVGLMHANGHGVAQNAAEAYMWFLIAAANGNEQAKSLYEGATNLDTLMTPEQKAQAERRAAAWRPSAVD